MREPAEGPDAEEPPREGSPEEPSVSDADERDAIADPDGDAEGDSGDDAPTLAAILGAEDEELPPRGPLVPERPSPEHVLFVVLGVLLGGYVFWRAAAVFSP